MRTRLFSILFLLLTAVMGTWAQNVTPEQAKQIAAQFLQGKRTDKSSKRAPGQNELLTCALQNRFFKMNFPDLVQTGLKDKTFNF